MLSVCFVSCIIHNGGGLRPHPQRWAAALRLRAHHRGNHYGRWKGTTYNTIRQCLYTQVPGPGALGGRPTTHGSCRPFLTFSQPPGISCHILLCSMVGFLIFIESVTEVIPKWTNIIQKAIRKRPPSTTTGRGRDTHAHRHTPTHNHRGGGGTHRQTMTMARQPLDDHDHDHGSRPLAQVTSHIKTFDAHTSATIAMSVNPPIHIGFKGIWTTELQQDWTAFQVKQQVDGIERVISFIRSRAFLCLLCIRAVLDLVMGFSWLGVR